MSTEALFRPFELKGLRLPNRVVMAPMTRSMSPGGVITRDMADYYARRAENNVGLIITEGSGVDRPAALNDPRTPRFHGEAELAGWKRVFDAVHAKGGLIAPQLWHVGAVISLDLPDHTPSGRIDSPSGLWSPGKRSGEGMSEEEVADTLAAFANAAAAAKAIGADAVALHGAHGYLIDQFFWAGTNERTDRFGGPSLKERSRFGAELVRTVRMAVGPDFPLLIRLSQWKQQDFSIKLAHTPEEMAEWLEPLADAGVDLFDCSTRRFWEPEFAGSDLNFAGWAKKLTGVATMTVGSVGLAGYDFIEAREKQDSSKPASLDNLIARLERKEFDLVGVGRALLQDPSWAVKVRDGRTSELMEFNRSALATLY